MKLMNQIFQKERPLIAWTVFAFFLITIRVIWTMNDEVQESFYYGNGLFIFLTWNLFLAWIPLLISQSLFVFQWPKWAQYFLLFLWLLFFPNAPYLVTDLIHVRAHPPIPIWYDCLLLFIFAGLGLWLAMRSLLLIRVQVLMLGGRFWANLWIYGSLLLSGLGIYLGRVLRWNSWDVFHNPFGPIKDVLLLFYHPFEYQSAWLMIILFSGFMSFLYWTVKDSVLGLNG